MAAGVATSRRPQRRFSVITKTEAKRTNQYRRDTTYYKRSKLTRRTPDIGEQEKRVQRRNAKTRSSAKALKGAGATMMVVGRGLPIIVYGYIGYDIARRLRADEKITKEEVIDEIWWYSFGPQAMAISQFQPSSSTSNLLQKMVSRVHGA